LIEGLDCELECLRLDSTLGYRDTSVGTIARFGLSNAVYRGLDITIAVPVLLQWLLDDKQWKREKSIELLTEFIEKKKEVLPQIIEMIPKPVNKQNKELQKLIRKCKTLLKN